MPAHDTFAAEFDYIVVGAGSAGCVLANRLSANSNIRVCLVEGGGRDGSPRIHVPAGTITLYRSNKYGYQFHSVPQRHFDGRSIHLPRGRGFGGSSSMNSMIYIRGHRSDYDRWAEMGCAGWSYDELLPFFKRSERNMLGQDPAYHGFDGELPVDRARDPSPLSRLFLEAARAAGYAETPDFNGAQMEGMGIYNVTQKDARRMSSYRAFVHPVKDRANLTIISDAKVLAVDLDGSRATGIVVEHRGQRVQLTAHRETILAAGAFGSPEILLRSGIGDPAELKDAGVEVRHPLSAVGRNLQDHIDGLVTHRSTSHETLGFSVRSMPRVLASPIKYLMKQMGWLTTNYVEAGGFVRTRYANDVPDVQMHFVPGYRSPVGKLYEWGHGFSIHTCVLRPESRGRVWLAGSNDGPQFKIDPNFLEKEQDGRVLAEGVKLARKILAAPQFDAIRGPEIAPGPQRQTNEEMLAYVRSDAQTVFHPSGTCRMGNDEAAVLSPDLKVRGLTGLRVADCSIMPTLISGNTNAPSIMIGEKCAALVLDQAPI